jgi:nitronate monooxygenase/enoyl-[acyl-carrier protein] reductase II
MLKTALCDALGIEVPIVLAPMAVLASPALLAAAVSGNGGLGSIGTLFRPTATIKRDIDEVRELTDLYAVNYIVPTLDADAFRYTLRARPAVISFALGDPGDLVRQAHDVGAQAMVQVTTVAQAIEAAQRGADVIIAQGGEAGGYGGSVSTMTLVPQVVDAVAPLPVVAAGGIFDGRGLAAALMLGASGVNLGTRFLASKEASIEDEWKQAIAASQSEETVKIDFMNDIAPLPGTGGYGTVLRVLRTPFVDRWATNREESRQAQERLIAEIVASARTGRRHETVIPTGQSAGGIKEVLPVAEIIHRLVAEAESALSRATRE